MVDGRLDVVLFTVCELSANLYKFEVRVCLRAARWKHLFHDFWLSLGFSGGTKVLSSVKYGAKNVANK